MSWLISLLSPIKTYLGLGIATVIAIFVGIFNYRGNKIDKLENEVEMKEQEAIVAQYVADKEKKTAQFVADNRVAKVEAEIPDEVPNEYNPNTKFYI